MVPLGQLRISVSARKQANNICQNLQIKLVSYTASSRLCDVRSAAQLRCRLTAARKHDVLAADPLTRAATAVTHSRTKLSLTESTP